MRIIRILVILIAVTIALSACSSTTSPTKSSPSIQAPTQQTQTSKPSVHTWLNQVNRAWVVAHAHNWDADAEDDGLRVWVELQDADENMIEYTKTNMPVEIKIYSTESKTYPLKPARIIYSSSSSLTNWDNDAFVSGARGIKDIAWEEINPALPPEDQEIGIIYVEITLPDSRVFSAQYAGTWISKP